MPKTLAKEPTIPRWREVYDGSWVTFGSEIELLRWRELVLLQIAGKIRELRPHPTWVLQEAFTNQFGQHIRAIRYTADSEYAECFAHGLWRHVIEEVKVIRYLRDGSKRKPTEGEDDRMRYKLLAFRHPDYYMNLVYREQPRKERRR